MLDVLIRYAYICTYPHILWYMGKKKGNDMQNLGKEMSLRQCTHTVYLAMFYSYVCGEFKGVFLLLSCAITYMYNKCIFLWSIYYIINCPIEKH